MAQKVFYIPRVVVKFHHFVKFDYAEEQSTVEEQVEGLMGESYQRLKTVFPHVEFRPLITSLTPDEITKLETEAREKNPGYASPNFQTYIAADFTKPFTDFKSDFLDIVIEKLDAGLPENENEADQILQDIADEAGSRKLDTNFFNELKEYADYPTAIARASAVAQSLASWDHVERAYVQSGPNRPPEDFYHEQGFHRAAPEGVNSDYAWGKAGGKGEDIPFIDIEQGWLLNQSNPDIQQHDDLPDDINVLWGINYKYRGHGAAVLGVVLSKDNDNYGTGMAHKTAVKGVISQWHMTFRRARNEENVRNRIQTIEDESARTIMASIFDSSEDAGIGLNPDYALGVSVNKAAVSTVIEDAANYFIIFAPAYNTHDAILKAADELAPGGVLLIEAQAYRPGDLDSPPPDGWGATNPPPPSDFTDDTPYLPVEIEEAIHDAIRTAVDNHITVIEPAGNGSFNLDDYVSDWGTDTHGPGIDSGAIIVAAAEPGGGTHTRLGRSNYGSWVDCFGWGNHIWTVGDGKNGIDDGLTDANRTVFTQTFGGTSGASAMVAGAAISLQGMYKAKTGDWHLSPGLMRRLLSDSNLNTTSSDASIYDIGVMPDLKRLYEIL